jgi:hypothetical protein
MSDPYRPQDPRPEDPVSGTVETGGFRSWTARSVGGDTGPEWQAWTWTSSGKRGISWLGLLLVLLGGALVLMQLLPGVTFTSLLLAALAIVFGAAWLVGGWTGATLPTLALGAWSGARILSELGYLDGDGWTPLFVGVALIAAWALASVQHVRRAWAMWVGLALVIFGLAGIGDLLPNGWDLLWPVVLVGLGLFLIVRRRPA